jgi:hypothetical protein
MSVCQLLKEWCPTTDNHHIIPVEYGGDPKGRTIALRPDIHQTIHRCIGNGRLRDEFFSSLTPSQRRIAMLLVSKIETAKLTATKKEEVMITLNINRSYYKKLEVLAKDRGMTTKKMAAILLQRTIERIK